MIRYYFTSFDLYYKLLNWVLYVVADVIWNHIRRDMDAQTFIAYILLKVILTLVVLYILCIDAYHLQYLYKMRAMALLTVLIIYCSLCIANQVYILNPFEGWEDMQVHIGHIGDIQIPPLSLQWVMLSALTNFIIFILKQVILMILHPNQAFIEVYPAIQWVNG